MTASFTSQTVNHANIYRYGCQPDLQRNEAVLDPIQESVAMLDKYLAKGYYVYGIFNEAFAMRSIQLRLAGANTGFGASADSRTKKVSLLQQALLQHTQSGVLTSMDLGTSLGCIDHVSSHSMPAAWVLGTMFVRCNSLLRGHSAVSFETIESIMALVRIGWTPVTPLRGTVSASGDLLPLSYIAGAIEGSPDIRINVGKGVSQKFVSAKEALDMAGLSPRRLGPKEGLGLINGTAASAALGSLALYETHHLAVLTQILTAVAVEALQGSAESFHPFIAGARPHVGQLEVAQNIRSFLKGSTLAKDLETAKDRTKLGLVQDRYAVRSAGQWIGPQVEDLLLADSQVSTELNSTTDNPLLDVQAGEVYSGANFQAVTITSAMEKARLSLQMLGKLMFAQYSELIHPSHNNGLPANLAADDPSLSFTMKGVDVNLASYMSELAFLANPVSSHVQSAEMHNQALNSLAFITTRYTMHSVDLVSLMCASCLYVGCQALDLRVLQLDFFKALRPAVEAFTREIFSQALSQDGIQTLNAELWKRIPGAWYESTTLDACDRYEHVADTSIAVLANFVARSEASTSESRISVSTLGVWKRRALSTFEKVYTSVHSEFCDRSTTAKHLGHAAKIMYTFVRSDLGIPLHRGITEHPSPDDDPTAPFHGREKKIIGSWISIIYEALRSGKLHGPAMACLSQDQAANGAL